MHVSGVIRLSLDWWTEVNDNPSPSEAPEAVMAVATYDLVSRNRNPSSASIGQTQRRSSEPPPACPVGRGPGPAPRAHTPPRRRAPCRSAVEAIIAVKCHHHTAGATERRAERSRGQQLRSLFRLCVQPEREHTERVGVRASTRRIVGWGSSSIAICERHRHTTQARGRAHPWLAVAGNPRLLRSFDVKLFTAT